jgi:ribonuclease-3
MSNLIDLQQRLGATFKDDSLLRRALTHRSYLNENPHEQEDNERLEFLGDAVLDFLIAANLYNRFPDLNEGPLTSIRSALVRTEQLAEFARCIELGPAIRLGKGESEAGGRERESVLCSTFEAVLGALYLDSGLVAVQPIIDRLFLPVAQVVAAQENHIDHKSQFQVWAQAHLNHTPRYHTLSHTGPDHERTFTVEVRVNGEVFGTGTGRSKKLAEQAAARDALLKVEAL